MTQTRRCKISYGDEESTGNFIRYGESIYFDDGNNALQKTIAIVELDTGRVVEVEPYRVTFIK